MRAVTLDWVQQYTGAQALSTRQRNFTAIETDTRKPMKDALFIALKGESFDGHDFVKAAVEAGAGAVLVHNVTPEIQALAPKVTILKVNDTLHALQQMGQGARRESTAVILALTGSNGKTTTKEFTATILAPTLNVHYSKGSFNNHWGVPFSLLQLRPEHQAAVIEMGMNHPGEIEQLVRIAEPDAVMCTTVGRAHIEFFGSEEKIAKAKEEIYEFAPAMSRMVFNLDNPWTAAMAAKYRLQKGRHAFLTFSEDAGKAADVSLRIVSSSLSALDIEGTIAGEKGRARVPVFGAHNLTNLMAAAGLALAAGLKPAAIWQGLTQCKTIWGRNQFIALESGAEMIFDAYNANPDSMAALLANVQMISPDRRRIGVFGQMKELGAHSAKMHEDLGEQVGRAGFAEVFFVGEDRPSFEKGLLRAGYKGPVHAADKFAPGLSEKLGADLRQNDVIVVKGSRGSKLEQFIEPCRPLGTDWKKS